MKPKVHTRALFDGFNRADFGEWALGAGEWSMGAGEMVQSSVLAQSSAHVPRLRPTSSVARVQARLMELNTDPNLDTGFKVGVAMTPGGVNIGSGYVCFANARGTNHVILLTRRHTTGQEDRLQEQPVSGRFAVGGVVSVVAQSDDVTPLRTCNATQRTPPAAAQRPALSGEMALDAGELMVITERASVAVLAVDLIAIGDRCP